MSTTPDHGQSGVHMAAAVRLALEFQGLAHDREILKVIRRIVRDVRVDSSATEPTRLLLDAIKIERRQSA